MAAPDGPIVPPRRPGAKRLIPHRTAMRSLEPPRPRTPAGRAKTSALPLLAALLLLLLLAAGRASAQSSRSLATPITRQFAFPTAFSRPALATKQALPSQASQSTATGSAADGRTASAASATGTQSAGMASGTVLASGSLTRTGSALPSATRTGTFSGPSSALPGSPQGQQTATARTTPPSDSNHSPTATRTFGGNGNPFIPQVTNPIPKTLVIYMTTTAATTTTQPVVLITTQLPDGSIITIAAPPNNTNGDTVGGVPVKNLVIAGCVVGGAIVVGLAGVYGYKWLRGGRRETLEERKGIRGESHWTRPPPKYDRGGGDDEGQWDRSYAWDAAPAAAAAGGGSKRGSQVILWQAPPAAGTPAFSPPSGPAPSWSTPGGGSGINSAEDLMAALTQNIHGSAGSVQVPTVIPRSSTDPDLALAAAALAAGAVVPPISTPRQEPAKAPTPPPAAEPKRMSRGPIPAAIDTKMVRSATAPSLPVAAQPPARFAGPEMAQVAMPPPAAAQGPPGTTSINAALAIAAGAPGQRPRTVATNDITVEVYRHAGASGSDTLQRYAKAGKRPAGPKPGPGRSSTMQGVSPRLMEQGYAPGPGDGTWPGPLHRASTYGDEAIARHGEAVPARADGQLKRQSRVPKPGMPQSPASGKPKKAREAQTWDAVVDVGGEFYAGTEGQGRQGGTR
ncbi:hypothetical protein DFJ74DRAFT_764808 [Hyaloraphidium curvatum]|nr:hypothetical protein DFJ74DRAFT_764808 [Hyaloraphidium curvatum]